MKLPFLPKFNKKIAPLYFLVLVLRDEKANAVVFEEIKGEVKIVGAKEEYFSNSIDEASPEEFLETLDKAISQAESSLPENIQTQKTIFGVKEDWTENDRIKKKYLAKLKNASEELGLTPIGFLVISQAISHLLAKEEGAPVSAILTEVNEKTVTITLIRAGKTIETKTSEIHESIPFTVDTVLKHFNIPEILPSRIIIFNGKEDLSQEFITHTWSKSLPFLHLPQITNLPDGFDAKAVLFGAATQMGFEILEEDMPATTEKQKENEIQKISPSAEELDKFSASEKENSIEDPIPYNNFDSQDFGFARDIDVAKIPISPKMSVASRGGPAPREEEFQEREKKEEPEAEETFLPLQKMSGVNNILTLIKSILFSALGILLVFAKKINIKNILSILARAPKGKLTIMMPAILILGIALIAGYFLFIKATIEITVDPKITEQNRSVLFSTTDPTDPGKNIIKGEFVSVSKDGSVSTDATGKKDVGTNAKGAVIIYNDSDVAKNLAEGAILKAPNGLEFTLDSPTTIKAVASHSANENPPPEKTTANATANQLGKESNLPSGTKFSVASFGASEVIAINDNPFSGGTKKEVTVVSKNDQDKLEEELPKQLENNAKEGLIKKIGQNKVLVPAFVSNSITKKSMNARVGDEANRVTLTGTVEYQGISYDKNDLISFSKSLLEKNVPSAQQIDYNNVKTSVRNLQSKNGEDVEANLNIKALLLPKIDENKLIKDIKGKSFKAVEDLLFKLSQVSDVDILFSPKLPFLPKNLPIREKNIKILIKVNG